ncbi:ShlB/FhaC/HecB family hemolysin secretion/activation protein [Amphibiibacter pelophylacis]|uniref:ShlB/FhaC/HecB family hemolysin secretion/activation protein n=1 Tax=Amphibiibacter pelophylacis TaxID=1799477 RepID=A0ACC6P471_9BURK
MHSGLALAQSPDPDAQLRLQQQRSEEARRQLQGDAPVFIQPGAATAPSAPWPDEQPCFAIRSVTLQSPDGQPVPPELARIALAAAGPGGPADPAGRCLGTAGVNRVLSAVQDALVSGGYVTSRAVAAPQDLRSGVLQVTLVPGRVSQVRLQGAPQRPAALWNSLPTGPGQLLNLRDIEQGLENLKRVPTADVDIQIAPAAGDPAPGASDLLLQYSSRPPVRVALGLDNGGSLATGRWQSTATFSMDNPLTLSDLFYVSVTRNAGLLDGADAPPRAADGRRGYGTAGYSLHYSVPWGYSLLSFTGGRSSYQQTVAGASQDYSYSGSSLTGDLSLSRTLLRDRNSRTVLTVGGFLRSSRSYIDDTEIGVQQRSTAGWWLGLDQTLDSQGVRWAWGLDYRRGTGALGSRPAPEEDFGEGTSRFGVVRARLSVQAPLQFVMPWGLQAGSISTAWNGQRALTPLTPQDRFSIGGRYSVRGFDGETSLTARSGWVSRTELALNLGQSPSQLYLALDSGRTVGPETRLQLGDRLVGLALGVRGSWTVARPMPWVLTWDLFAGRPVSRPQGFRTASATLGVSLNLNF